MTVCSSGEPNRVGPNLYDIVGHEIGTGRGGFNFSAAMKAKGGKWTYDELNAFLKNPRGAIPGTNMTFAGLSRDGTFPFLGHILEEAHVFWNAGADGLREWGPCAEVDEGGREFHYLVKALRVGTRAYLVFQVDEGAERLRRVLQKVRSGALAEEQNPPQG